jgi:Cu/Ag efflux pump CusA
VPLVIASGAGAATVRAVGTAVFGGMIAASCLGIFVIPGLYVLAQSFRETLKQLAMPKPPAVAEQTAPDRAAE